MAMMLSPHPHDGTAEEGRRRTTSYKLSSKHMRTTKKCGGDPTSSSSTSSTWMLPTTLLPRGPSCDVQKLSQDLTNFMSLTTSLKKIGVEGIMKMWDFEGVKNPEVKFSQNKTKGSQGKRMTYNAVGFRVNINRNLLRVWWGSNTTI